MASPLGKPDNAADAVSGRNPQGRDKSGALRRCGSSQGAPHCRVAAPCIASRFVSGATVA